MKTNVQRTATISRVIGRGQTGCALRPSVPCDKKDPSRNTISKVFRTKKEQERELKRQNSIVKEIDPTNIFTMKFHIGCEINGTKLRKAELIECQFDEQDTFYQLIYQDGGVNISVAAKTIPFEVIFDSLRTAFLGLELMREKGIIHSDIKPDNIVYNEKTNKLAIIDFGLCTKLNDRRFISNRNVECNHPFMYWPSEFNAMATKPCTLLNSQGLNMFATEKLIKRLEQNPTLHNIRNKMNELKDLCDTKPPEMYYWRHVPETEHHLYTRKQITNYHGLLDENTNRSWRTVDVYGLGASIIEVLAISYKANPTMITTLNQDFYVAVVDLCMQMMATNPCARLEPLVAIAKHELIVARLSPTDQKRMARWIEIGPGILIDQIMDNCRELKRLGEVRKIADLSSIETAIKSKVTRASTSNTLLRTDHRNGQHTVATTEKPTIVTKGTTRTRTRAVTKP
jgi:serine/threonine protein kinase